MEKKTKAEKEHELTEEQYERLKDIYIEALCMSFASWDRTRSFRCYDCVKCHDYSCGHIGKDWDFNHRQVACPFYIPWRAEIAAQFQPPEIAEAILARDKRLKRP